MAFKLKDRIFKLYGNYIIKTDSYKNLEGRGLLQRYNELCAEDYDNNLQPRIESLVDNTLVPQTTLLNFLPYLNYMIGGSLFLGTAEDQIRKSIRFATKLYQIKGTILSYETAFKMLGFTSIIIIEYPAGGTFDNGNTTSEVQAEPYFDDFYRTFDETCPSCSAYTIRIYGDLTLTDELHKAIFRAISFCEPINAQLRSAYYNDTLLIADDLISIFVDNNGDLIYDNVATPLTAITLTSEGDLTSNVPGYSIDRNGDINYG